MMTIFEKIIAGPIALIISIFLWLMLFPGNERPVYSSRELLIINPLSTTTKAEIYGSNIYKDGKPVAIKLVTPDLVAMIIIATDTPYMFIESLTPKK